MNLGKLILLYWNNSGVARITRKTNPLSMLRIIEVATGKSRQAELIPLTDIGPDLVARYQSETLANYLAAANKDDGAQKEARDRSLRTTRSRIIQARSMFTAEMLAVYKAHGIEIPQSVLDFCSCPVKGKSTRRHYVTPPEEVVAATFEQIELMKADRDVFCGFWLACGACLRRSEIGRCRWEHIREIDGRPRLIGGIGKCGELIDVGIQRRAYEALQPLRKEAGFVIEERGDRWARRLSHWMRDMGWNSRKTLHELRSLVGSLIYKHSPVNAMRQLRHSTISTTERHYVRYQTGSENIEVL